MPHGDWDDISPAMRRALKALRDAGGFGVAGDIRPKVRSQTWRSLHRYALIRTSSMDSPHIGSMVYLTDSGREHVGDEP